MKNFSRKFFNDIGSENELLTLIEQTEKQRSNKGREDKENLYDHYDLDNWVSVNTQV
ncbi:hypothetical protein GNF82_17395 [Clostridium perfringens]